jgi:hypothetical protein
MGGGNFPVYAVVEPDGCHGGGHFQHLSSAPFQSAGMAYEYSPFDSHRIMPHLFGGVVGAARKQIKTVFAKCVFCEKFVYLYKFHIV